MRFLIGKKGLICGLVLFVLLLISSVAYLFYAPHRVSEEREVLVTIEAGATGAEIAEQLYEKELISSTTAFRVALRISGVMNKLQEGYYRITTTSSMANIIDTLQQGQEKTVRITIPEGFTIKEIATRMEENGIGTAQDFLKVGETFVPYQYMYGPKPVSYRTEGFLFPSTYDVPVNATVLDVQKMMTKEMNVRLTKRLEPRLTAFLKKYHMSIYNFVVLASLVEREALFDSERAMIASVFLKRLAIDMPLQSCASIEYLLGTRKPILSEEDIRIDSPYNTYLHKGLPPSPIANPGMKSMEAVLAATDTENLFFVADKDGHHRFSKTYEEHLQQIESIYGQ